MLCRLGLEQYLNYLLPFILSLLDCLFSSSAILPPCPFCALSLLSAPVLIPYVCRDISPKGTAQCLTQTRPSSNGATKFGRLRNALPRNYAGFPSVCDLAHLE